MRAAASLARLSNLAATEATLRDALLALHDVGVTAMPLKGVLLRRLVYDDPVERAVGDVDLLVRGRDLRAAHQALVARGFEAIFLEPTERQRGFRHSRLGVLVDLHWQLFYEDYFDLDAEDLFARATWDLEGFATPVWRMAPLDLYAHVLAHLGFTAWVLERPRVEDLARITERLRIAPDAAAAHLRAHGMDRFARYALRYAMQQSADPHPSRVLAALGAAPLDDAVARAVLRTMPAIRSHPYLAYAPRRMLYRSIEEVVANGALVSARAVAWAARRTRAALRG